MQCLSIIEMILQKVCIHRIVPQKVGENCFEMVIKRRLKMFPNDDGAGAKRDVNVSKSALMLTDCCLITMETSIREEEGEGHYSRNTNAVKDQ